MEKYWPDLECYGDLKKYTLFWTYQWDKHGKFSGLMQEDFFTMSINFIKSLPPEMGLTPGSLTTLGVVATCLNNTLSYKCSTLEGCLRGFVLDEENICFCPLILREIAIATDKNFIVQDTWKAVDTKSKDRILIPNFPLKTYRSQGEDLLYVGGQNNQVIREDLEYIKDRMREKIFMEKDNVAFNILENEQTHQKLAVLVISARKGAFDNEGKQRAIQHVQNAKSWNIPHMLVVVSQMEGVMWDKIRYETLEGEINKITKISYECVEYVPISKDCNVKRKCEKAIAYWCKKRSLYQCLDEFEDPKRDVNGPLRMSIIEPSFETGDIIPCEIESGTIRRDDRLLIMPSKECVEVVKIFIGDNEKNNAEAGQFVQVQLLGIKDKNIYSRCVLSSIAKPVHAVYAFEAKMSILDLLDSEKLFVGFKATLHIHSTVVECEIVRLIQEFNPETRIPMKKEPPSYVKKGALLSCRIEVKQLICIEKYSDTPGFGQFVLKVEGRIIAAGIVTYLVEQS